MVNEVLKQKVMIELEEKAKRKALTNYITKLQEVNKLKGEGRYEPPLPPVKKQQTAQEILDGIYEGWKDRFQDDKKSIQQMAEIRKGPRPTVYPKKKPDYTYGEEMYSVDPEVLNSLYEGISHNDEGRKLYLKLRKIPSPSDRFRFSQTQNMDYGWEVEERKHPTAKEFAKVELINRNFYRRYGAIKGETLRNRPPYNPGMPSTPLL